MMPSDPKQLGEMVVYMLTACENDLDKLSPWEQDFIESIRSRIDNGWTLSNRQAEKLEQIYNKL